MSGAIDPKRARVAVYAVSIGYELGLDRTNLDAIRRIAESQSSYDSGPEAAHRSIIDLATEYSIWDDLADIQQVDGTWPTAKAKQFDCELLEALERVRHLIQPMNRI